VTVADAAVRNSGSGVACTFTSEVEPFHTLYQVLQTRAVVA